MEKESQEALERLSYLVNDVEYGIKPLAEITVATKYDADLAQKVQAAASDRGILFHKVLRDENRVTFFLYKHPHMLNVIKHMDEAETEDDIFEIWVAGKAFGLSEEAVEKTIREDNSLVGYLPKNVLP